MNFSIDLAMSVIKSSSDFPIDFNEAWQWLEFSRKDSGLRSFLECGFVESIDFNRFHRKEKSGILYRDIEYYQLTVECFKTWAMMVNTAKGKEVRKYFIECEKQLKTLTKPEPLTAIQWYSKRVGLLRETLKKPAGTWCVIEKCSHLLLEIERAGYRIDEHDLLDGSVGKMWSFYRKEKEWALPSFLADYDFRNQRTVKQINAYQYPELSYFAIWLESIYEPKHLLAYLKTQEKKGKLLNATNKNILKER